MNMHDIRWYHSRIDWWIALVLALPPVMLLLVWWVMMIDGRHSEGLGMLVALGLLLVVYIGLVFPMRYGLDDSRLLICFGFCRIRIPLAEIKEVYPTRNPLSSPALSLDRLHIQYGEGRFKFVMISPADREGFLDELAHRTGLQERQGKWVRI